MNSKIIKNVKQKSINYFLKNRYNLIIILLFISIQSYCQTRITGFVYDKSNSKPLAYCNVLVKGTSRGCITNEDGKFELLVDVNNDILKISYLSYKTIIIPASSLLSNSKVYMYSDVFHLKEVTIKSNNDYLYELVDNCRKKNSITPSIKSKAYFSIETETQKSPVEVIECYYNAEIENNSVKEITIKNGRIGLASLNNSYFLNLSTSYMLKSYDIFNISSLNLYSNPLQLNKKLLKKLYNLNLVSISGTDKNIYQIIFTPKKSKSELFKGEIWFEKNTFNIIKFILTEKNLSKYPLSPINPNHKNDSICLTLSYSFINDNSINRLDFINFNYSLIYNNEVSSKIYNSNGVLYFYDKDNLFYPPKFIENNSFNDYDKILAMPYNEVFWKNNDIIIMSDKKKEYIKFFSKNGMLLNYNDFNSKDKELLDIKNQKWSALNKLNLNQFIKKINNSENILLYNKAYNFSGYIFLDVNQFGDSLSYNTSTIIDIQKSYYSSQANNFTKDFINNYFDLIEIQRLKMVNEFNKSKKTTQEIESIYNINNIELNNIHNKYLKDVDRGFNEKEILKWNKHISDNLKMYNFQISIDSIHGVRDLNIVESENEMYVIVKYNAGVEAYNSGFYEKAKMFFFDAISMNDTHPWLYYNLALTYFKLGDLENSCKYINISIEKGEKIDTELKNAICRK